MLLGIGLLFADVRPDALRVGRLESAIFLHVGNQDALLALGQL